MKMASVNVRKMNINDLDSVIEIENISFLSPWSRESFEREIRENMLARYFVIEYDEKVVGYGGMWFIVDEAHITNIAVHPDFRGMQLGTFLVKSMIDYAESSGIYKMTLEVRKSNTPAQMLYKKLGFVECGIRPRYYENQEDAIIMWRET